jgi:hypothetical protein
VRVGGVLVGTYPDIGDLGDPSISAQIALQRFLVLIAGVVGADDDPQTCCHISDLPGKS